MYKISLREKATGQRLGCLKDNRNRLVTATTFEEAVKLAKIAVAESGDTLETSIFKIRAK